MICTSIATLLLIILQTTSVSTLQYTLVFSSRPIIRVFTNVYKFVNLNWSGVSHCGFVIGTRLAEIRHTLTQTYSCLSVSLGARPSILGEFMLTLI